MAFDPYLQERIDQNLNRRKVEYVSKKMMGGLCYMVDDKMCIGIMWQKEGYPHQIMARIGAEAMIDALSHEGVHDTMYNGRSLKGYAFIDENAIDTDEQLDYWIQLALDYNPLAKLSKKKRKKT